MDSLATAIALMNPHIPKGTTLTIEEHSVNNRPYYVYRLMYTSQRSGKQWCSTAKGDKLVGEDGDLMRFYLLQLIVDPKELPLKFSQLAWFEKRARQVEWMSNGHTRIDGKDAYLVSKKEDRKDNLGYTGYIS